MEFIISKDVGTKVKLTTKTGLQLATEYNRIVIGKRGPYVEFKKPHILFMNLYIPDNEKWRIDSPSCYYIEYRSIDTSFVKIYQQKETVTYADYLKEYYYISPYDLYINGENLIYRHNNTINLFF